MKKYYVEVNGDGKIDTFEVYGLDESDIYLQIIDMSRWNEIDDIKIIEVK